MSLEARVRIDSHRLMRNEEEKTHELRVESARFEHEARKKGLVLMKKRRVKIHIGIFTISFLFSLGVFTLGTLLLIEPDDLVMLVFVAIISSVAFVAMFSWLRMFILHTILNEYPNKEEDPGTMHHLSKSIAYGFVALVLALVLVGILVNVALADVTT